MARQYPRFLLTNPSNTKSSGPFIIHTLEPRFICIPKFDDSRNLIHASFVEAWNEDSDMMKIHRIMNELPEWYRHSGVYQSTHPDDQVLAQIKAFEFLQNYQEEMTVMEARKMIKVLFPTKAAKAYEAHNSYGIKHLFERISGHVIKTHARKYCGNDTVIEAFNKEGFTGERSSPTSPNWSFNITEKEGNRAYRLFR